MLLVRPVQSFVAGLCGNMDAAQKYMNLWAIERDAAMDGEDVSRLVAGAFLEHANLDIGITDYRHLVAYHYNKRGVYCDPNIMQTTKKKVSENPQLRTKISRKLLSCYETITFAPVQSQVLRNSQN
jgi:hypothetical protein